MRNRIVVGMLDKELSRKLQLRMDLTLALTVEKVRQEVALQVSMQGEAADMIREVTHKRSSNFNQHICLAAFSFPFALHLNVPKATLWSATAINK